MAIKDVIKAGIKDVKKTFSTLLHFPCGLHFLHNEDPVFHGAPVVIFITPPKDNEWAPLDVGMCCQNMMLSAKLQGLDSCPVGFGKYVEQTSEYAQLHISSSEHVLLALILSYGDETPLMHERVRNNLFYIE